MTILLAALRAAAALTALSLLSQSGRIWSIVTTSLAFDDTLLRRTVSFGGTGGPGDVEPEPVCGSSDRLRAWLNPLALGSGEEARWMADALMAEAEAPLTGVGAVGVGRS